MPTIEEHYLTDSLQFTGLARMDETSENRGADGHTGPVEKGSTEIVAAISNMSSLLAKSLATLQSTMAKSFDDMKTSLDQLTVEEIHDGPSSIESDDEAPGAKRAKTDSGNNRTQASNLAHV